MAWAGDALTQLYSATGRKDLPGRRRGRGATGSRPTAGTIAGRVATPAGLYRIGKNKIEWKSTEHNIDVYAFFRLLARETGKSCLVI